MKYTKKGRFVLDIKCLQYIVDDILKQPRYKDVEIRIKKSDNANSKSLYLFFYIGQSTTCLRISDHDCKGYVRQMIVGESTGKANVYYKIDCTIKELRIKKLYEALEKQRGDNEL